MAVDVVVVGAGLAGLAAARELTKAGLVTVVCEAGPEVGGRVRTDYVDGFQLDHGFQVLLPAYPELPRHLDLAALDLRPFTRGVLASTARGRRWLTPPSHGLSALADTARFALRRPVDLARLGALSARDTIAPDIMLRQPQGVTVEQELRRWRLSADFREEVLRPFVAGVFLDPDLMTSARLFHLVWRCFLRGGGALPAAGMHAIPRQLAEGLPEGTVRTNAPIAAVTEHGVVLASGQTITARAVVVATDGTDAARLLPGLTAPEWHAVTTHYFRTSGSPLRSPTLVLDGASGLLINTVVLDEVAPAYAPSGQSLVAASVPGRPGVPEAKVREQLARMYETDVRDWDLMATHTIPRALPVFGPEQPLRRPVRHSPGRYVCGDHRDTPSIQGALVSGRRAAEAVLRDLKQGL
ncbi:phytoene dehydrogenase-like protein [Amycolatopsis bartoniae]|uniref:Oxidoreductase n=1 Tax=Amycolatopsis bartoniae TaxID=941986 RepID=A0A8H9IMX2_9PSEU|nr:NAD(P)/FAD-dependent oxidoreductase [Amycolatopsis bartoniae]MBB2938229.1 phytoene dehydrogenase-like protein [Amycolatopsis bartoniae]TVT09009.1 FAD-dependent oxidoreductase [Amycolatopsis bartoniae]GHF33629.1 oxidoreductase [Amycolatopsis bartoniae]